MRSLVVFLNVSSEDRKCTSKQIRNLTHSVFIINFPYYLTQCDNCSWKRIIKGLKNRVHICWIVMPHGVWIGWSEPWRWRQQSPPKRWYPTTTLHGVKTHSPWRWMQQGPQKHNPEDLDFKHHRHESLKYHNLRIGRPSNQTKLFRSSLRGMVSLWFVSLRSKIPHHLV
jgi:hypothetical protein